MFFYDVQDCIGTIDGSHIKVEVHNGDKPHYRDRKVDISQNIMVICSFNMKFFYMNAGWEGLAVDFTLLYSFLRDLCASRLFYYFIFYISICIRINFVLYFTAKYYIVYAGYPNTNQFIAYYRGIRQP